MSLPARRVGALSLPRRLQLRNGQLQLALVDDAVTPLRQRTVKHAQRLQITGQHDVADIPAHADITFDVASNDDTVRIELAPRWDGTSSRVDVTSSAAAS